jgi:hypothetical protein
MGVWQGVAIDCLKFYPGPPCPPLLRPAGGPPLKRPYGRFRSGTPADGRPAAILSTLLNNPRRAPNFDVQINSGSSRRVFLLHRFKLSVSPERTTDYRLQTTDYRLLTTDYRLQTTDYRLQTTDYRLQTTDYSMV